MTIFHAVVLGAVQGLTEFLPVSSSGHLVLLQRLFGIEEPSLFFDTLVHAGTLGAVLVVLWGDVRALLRNPFQKLTLLLIIATLPTVAAAILFNNAIEEAFQNGAFLGPAFLLTALALTASELLSTRAGRLTVKRPLESMNIPDALAIGVCQGIAILPAVSRSGLTLAGSLLRGIDRGSAARFSFLISIPAILGALVLQIAGLRQGGPAIDAPPLIAGMVTAFLTGLLAVKLMLRIVRKRRLYAFAAYTAVLGILCIVLPR
jgi:undecaprenyl-diphosphatase